MRKSFLAILAVFMVVALAGCAHQGKNSPAPAKAQKASAKAAAAPVKTAPAAPAKAESGKSQAPPADIYADDEEPAPVAPDVLEPFSRAMFFLNDKLYLYVLDPFGRGYRKVVPVDMRRGIKNFFYNLQTPVRFVSSVLQGKMERAGVEVLRLVINSTIGIGGVNDAADMLFRLPKPPEEDLGQTFGRWGIGHGAYIVWPLLGPSSLRDSVGVVGGWYLDPVNYYVEPDIAAYEITAGRYLNDYSFRVGDYESIVQGAIDPYVAVKDFYLRYRALKVKE